MSPDLGQKKDIIYSVSRNTAAKILNIDTNVLQVFSTKGVINIRSTGPHSVSSEEWNINDIAKAYCVLELVDKTAWKKNYKSYSGEVNAIIFNKKGNRFKDIFSRPQWTEVINRARKEGIIIKDDSPYIIKP